MRRVLIVDDDPRVRAALTALITATTDLTVAAAVGTARDARAALATRPVDLILVDVQLPHRDDGIGLIQTLSRRHLVVAMSIDGSRRAPALRAGAADFLEKNGNPDDILEALHRTTTTALKTLDWRTPPKPDAFANQLVDLQDQ